MDLSDRITAVRREGRHALGLMRRLAGGARGLSPRATAGLLAERVSRAPAGEVENSSFTFVMAADDSTTQVWVHNYWSDAYGIARPSIEATLLSEGGVAVDRWTFVLEPDTTVLIDVRDRLRALNHSLPFEGQLLLVTQHEKLGPGRPLQVFAEYVRDDGEATGVHGQYGYMRKPAAQVVGSMRVEAGAGRRTSVVVVNPYVGPGAPAALRAGVTVHAADGRSRHAKLAPLAPLVSRRVFLDDLFTDLPAFLAGEPGHASVTLPCPSSRVATLIDFADGRGPVVNHGTVDRVFQADRGAPRGWAAGSVASVPVILTARRDTVLTLPNSWGPISSAYDAVLDVYAPDGSRLSTHRVNVPRDGLRTLSFRELLGGPESCLAHCEVRVEAGLDEMPAQFDVLVGLVDDGRLAGEVQVGSTFLNSDVPAGVRLPDIRRTRVFGRVRVAPGARTTIFVANAGPRAGYDVTAEPTFTLLDPVGARVATATVTLAPHGCLLATVDELFPGASGALGAADHGTVRVRDTSARLYGYYFVETDGAHTLPICHLIGG